MGAGQNETVRSATRRPRIVGRGLRILAMDGGGMKASLGLLAAAAAAGGLAPERCTRSAWCPSTRHVLHA